MIKADRAQMKSGNGAVEYYPRSKLHFRGILLFDESFNFLFQFAVDVAVSCRFLSLRIFINILTLHSCRRHTWSWQSETETVALKHLSSRRKVDRLTLEHLETYFCVIPAQKNQKSHEGMLTVNI